MANRKSIMFHFNNLTFRGTTTAIIDYAKYNEELLNNKSIIAYPKSLLSDTGEMNSTKRIEISSYLKNNHDVIEYETKEELKAQLDHMNCDYAYYLKAGMIDNDYLEGKFNLIHCVFNHFQPHGHKYAYISNWLKNSATGFNVNYDFVPHIVQLPESPTINLKEYLGIPKEKIVVGRHGGFHEFDVQFAKEVVCHVLANDDSFVFVFLNTEPFVSHENVIYLNSIFDSQEKTNYIAGCDIMLQARSRGESFGLAICEGLFHNKPVLSFASSIDRNNIELTDGYGLIYNSPDELYNKLINFKTLPQIRYKNITDEFSPEKVMEKFDAVFLK